VRAVKDVKSSTGYGSEEEEQEDGEDCPETAAAADVSVTTATVAASVRLWTVRWAGSRVVEVGFVCGGRWWVVWGGCGGVSGGAIGCWF
jgi:hypothetical protein